MPVSTKYDTEKCSVSRSYPSRIRDTAHAIRWTNNIATCPADNGGGAYNLPFNQTPLATITCVVGVGVDNKTFASVVSFGVHTFVIIRTGENPCVCSGVLYIHSRRTEVYTGVMCREITDITWRRVM